MRSLKCLAYMMSSLGLSCFLVLNTPAQAAREQDPQRAEEESSGGIDIVDLIRKVDVDSILSKKPYARIAPDAVAEDVGKKPFDMEYIRNVPSLETEVIHDWHKVDGPVPTIQKHIEITVCEWWPGCRWRVPVHLTVPEGGAHGFIITGRGGFEEEDQKESGELLANGVGKVATKVQALVAYPGGREAELTSMALFARTGDFRYTTVWIWGMTIMRAATAALAEEDYIKPGKIAGFGGSKNGIAPAIALIHDDRFTGARPSVAPPHECPYRLEDPEAVREVEEANKRFFEAFDAGEIAVDHDRSWHIKHLYLRPMGELQEVMLANGWTAEDMRGVLREVYQMCAVSLNLDKLEKRGCEMLFNIGSHDNVTPDLAYLGAKYPQIPVCISPNGGHGQQGKGLLRFNSNGENYTAFMSNHFFGDRPMMVPPRLSYEKKEDKIEIEVEFQSDPPADTGTVYWMFDRDPSGTAGYVTFYFKLQKSMERVDERTWKTEIDLPEDAFIVDFFTFHSNIVNDMRAHISSPYARIKLK